MITNRFRLEINIRLSKGDKKETKMSKVYKIHPAIGIARLGNPETSFFVGPETPGDPGIEIAPDSTEGPITRYKETDQIRRQAARFRVYEYEASASGVRTRRAQSS